MKSIQSIVARRAALVAALSLTIAVSACGGGGGAPPSYSVPLLDAATTATYSSPSDGAVWSALKTMRLTSGAGIARQQSALDEAARAHASYLVANGFVDADSYLISSFPTSSSGLLIGGHYEQRGLSGFTGQSPQDRATYAGYHGTVNEVVTFGAPTAPDCVASLENSVYHLISLMSPFVDVGVSFNPGTGAGSVCVIAIGVPTSTQGQLPARDNYLLYPGNNAQGVAPVFANTAEIPTPVPDLPKAGHPVLVSLYTQATQSIAASDLRIDAFSLTPASGGSPVAARILVSPGVSSGGPTLTSDSNIAGPGFVVLVPVEPLLPSTTYTANFSATLAGLYPAVRRTWSFTTGALN